MIFDLKVPDVCSLGSCSRFWRELCESDCVWASLCRDRWPALDLDYQDSAPQFGNHLLDQHLDSTLKVEIISHMKLCVLFKLLLFIGSVVNFVEQSSLVF